MTLTGKHKAERATLEKLLQVLDSREPTIDSLKQAINGAIGWGYPDPTPHLREALRHYLADESNVVLNGAELDEAIDAAMRMLHELGRALPALPQRPRRQDAP